MDSLNLSKEEKERYSRHILLFGAQAQLSLKQARVLVLGIGGIGSGMLPYLASSGFGLIRIVDRDRVERINLARQNLFLDSDIGHPKGKVAQERLLKMNPYGKVIWEDTFFDKSNFQTLIEGSDIILEGTDDIENKFLVNDIAISQNIPALIGGLGPLQGHIFPVASQSKLACYRCIFENPPKDEIPGCSTTGVLSALPGVIGSMMAYLATLYFTQKKWKEKILLIENSGWREVFVTKSSGCIQKC